MAEFNSSAYMTDTQLSRVKRIPELTPGAPTGMAIGPQVAKPQATVIITAVIRAKVLRGVHLTRSSVRRRHGVGPHRCRGHGRFARRFTQRARGLFRQAFKRFGLGGTFPLGVDGLRLGSLLRRCGSSAWPGNMQHDEEPHECQQGELVKKKC